MSILLLSSFPNSRVKTRNPTSQEFTNNIACPAGVATKVLAADLNRTFVTLRNLSTTSQIYWGTVNTIDGSDANGGFLIEPLESANTIPTQQDIWVFNPSGSSINIALDYGDG